MLIQVPASCCSGSDYVEHGLAYLHGTLSFVHLGRAKAMTRFCPPQAQLLDASYGRLKPKGINY
jgi:hypothetical protein